LHFTAVTVQQGRRGGRQACQELEFSLTLEDVVSCFALHVFQMNSLDKLEFIWTSLVAVYVNAQFRAGLSQACWNQSIAEAAEPSLDLQLGGPLSALHLLCLLKG
jgi:hypothetical protein